MQACIVAYVNELKSTIADLREQIDASIEQTKISEQQLKLMEVLLGNKSQEVELLQQFKRRSEEA
jgi:hypothetical protein